MLAEILGVRWEGCPEAFLLWKGAHSVSGSLGEVAEAHEEKRSGRDDALHYWKADVPCASGLKIEQKRRKSHFPP